MNKWNIPNCSEKNNKIDGIEECNCNGETTRVNNTYPYIINNIGYNSISDSESTTLNMDKIRKLSKMKSISKKLQEDNNLPDNFTWQNQIKLFPVVDQCSCSICYIISTVSCVYDRYNVYFQNNPEYKKDIMPSILYIISNVRNNTSTFAESCSNGGKVTDVLKFFANYGCKTEKCWPYCLLFKENIQNISQPIIDLPSNCCYNCCGKNNETLFRVKDFYTIPRNNIYKDDELASIIPTIMKDIRDSGPVISIFNVNNDFSSWGTTGNKDVYIPSGTPSKSFHTVVIVGWGNDGIATYKNVKYTNIPYWIVRNSYGKKWGDDGYFKFIRSDWEYYSSVISSLTGIDLPFFYKEPSSNSSKLAGGIISFNISKNLGQLYKPTTSTEIITTSIILVISIVCVVIILKFIEIEF